MKGHTLLPQGYDVLSIKGSIMTVGICFEHFNDDAIDFIIYDGDRYKRGSLVFCKPLNFSDYCSCREYELVVEDKKEELLECIHDDCDNPGVVWYPENDTEQTGCNITCCVECKDLLSGQMIKDHMWPVFVRRDEEKYKARHNKEVLSVIAELDKKRKELEESLIK